MFLFLLSPLFTMGRLRRLALWAAVPALISALNSTVHDVLVVGGGSSGTYAAVRLQELGLRVALVEKECRLGGNTNTYHDPATGGTFDYGTQILVNTSTVRSFFASLDIPLAPLVSRGGAKAIDFRNNVEGPAWPIVTPADSAAALAKYKTILAQYPDSFFRGYHLPDPVPDDLLMPWGDFLKKYDLGALAYDAFLQFQGVGNSLAQPTLYIMKLFNPMQLAAREDNLKVTEANHNMQALWDAAQDKLGANAIVCANITSITRSPSGVSLTAKTPQGVTTLHAKKLIITIPPKVPFLSPFLSLTAEESSLFSGFNNSYYWNAVLANTGFPENVSIYNYNAKALFHVPALPGAYYFTSEISGLYSAQYSTPNFVSDEYFISDILQTVAAIRNTLKLPLPHLNTTITAWNNHSPSLLTVPINDIKDGFYKKFTALQGKTDTFWTGASWSSGSSSTIWDFTEQEIIPTIYKSLSSSP